MLPCSLKSIITLLKKGTLSSVRNTPSRPSGSSTSETNVPKKLNGMLPLSILISLTHIQCHPSFKLKRKASTTYSQHFPQNKNVFLFSACLSLNFHIKNLKTYLDYYMLLPVFPFSPSANHPADFSQLPQKFPLESSLYAGILLSRSLFPHYNARHPYLPAAYSFVPIHTFPAQDNIFR